MAGSHIDHNASPAIARCAPGATGSAVVSVKDSCGGDDEGLLPNIRGLPGIHRRKYRSGKASNVSTVKKDVHSATEEVSTTMASSNATTTTANSGVRYGLIKLLVLLIAQLPLARAMPVTHWYSHSRYVASAGPDGAVPPGTNLEEDPAGFWFNMGVSIALVLLGGVFAGLTLGLMGQDEVYLQVMKVSGEPHERRAASKVLALLSRGKHWVLVTLLLSNVITNETLPIVLDRSLGGGWPAVVGSTAAIVVFGEIIPQSISVRYGLGVGAMFAPFVLVLMYLMYPVAYPIAMLLDRILGEDHGTMYKRAGLKTLVTLHKSMGVERLNEDEVTIISAVLDLKEKPVGDIMTPMEDVFVLSADTILDEETMEKILHTGFNRIPIHVPGDPQNFIGMLLVRILITYDPEDALPISSFPLATLPETAPETTCLNILNYFQEGKSHMVVVSENPGESTGALGVLTLEDVIEELIGEEIIDESDVYVDVHKAIRRAHPGPFAKSPFAKAPFAKRQSNGSVNAPIAPQLERALMSALNGNAGDARAALKLGPSNRATAPLKTHTPNITVKQLNQQQQNAATGTALNGTAAHDDGDGDLGGVRRSTDSQAEHVSEPVVVRTEEGAIQEALLADADRREHALDNPGDLAYGDTTTSVIEPPESRSYRTGGIVESVVNVSGINKVVIGDEESRRSRRGSSASSKSTRSNSSVVAEDSRPLLSND